MASIVKDPGGKKRLQYTDPGSGKKSTIRLGKLEVRQAETVRTKVESLLSASITGSLDAETSKWVAAIDDRLHRKLAAKGLVPPRARSGHTLGALLDEYSGVGDRESVAGVAPAKATQKATPHAAEWRRTEPQSPGREVA